MAKDQGAGELLPLPFTTFGESAALGFEASVYCSRCYEHRSIDPGAGHLSGRCFARARFRCTKIRYTADVCDCPGSVELMPVVRLPVGGRLRLRFFVLQVLFAALRNQFCADRPAAVVSGEAQSR